MRNLLRLAAFLLAGPLLNGCLTYGLWYEFATSRVPCKITAASIDANEVLYVKADYRNGRTYIVSAALGEASAARSVCGEFRGAGDSEFPPSVMRVEIVPPDPYKRGAALCLYVEGSDVPAEQTRESFWMTPAERASWWRVRIDGRHGMDRVDMPRHAPINWCQGGTWITVGISPFALALDAALLPIEIVAGLCIVTGVIPVG